MRRVVVALQMPLAHRRRLTGLPLGSAVRAICGILLAVTLIVDGMIVLSPVTPAAAGQESLRAWLGVWRLLGIQPTFLTFGLVEWLSNVVMFMPVGFLFAGLVAPPLRAWAVLIAAGLSAAVEVTQVFLPNRVPSVYDVVANSLGALLGVLLLGAVSQWLGQRTDRG